MFFSRHNVCVLGSLFAIVASFGYSNRVAAVSVDSSRLETTATAETVRRVERAKGSTDISDIPLGVRRRLEQAFEIPISLEWPYVNEDRRTRDQPQLEFSLQPNTSLRKSLGQFCDSTSGALTWEFRSGVLVVRAPADAGGVENNLDTRVSLNLAGVSTWTAFKALARAINSKPLVARRIDIYPSFIGHSKKGPDNFRNDSSISLDLEDVTAREALCAIIAASPLELSYTYWLFYRPELNPEPDPISKIRIQLYEEGKHYTTHERISEEEMRQYLQEFSEMQGKN